MEVKLWKDFEKRRNSTKQPTSETYVTKEVRLKDACSLTNPVFFLSDTELYSYVQWKGLYYFVDKIVFDIDGAETISCTLDVLASWKSEILNTSAFIKYSTSSYNLKLPDNRIVPKVEISRAEENTPSDVFLSDAEQHQNEVVIVTALNQAGGIMRYVLDETSVKTVMGELQQEALTIWGSLLMDMTAALSCVIDLLRIPIDPAYLPDVGPITISFGDWYSTYQAAYLIANFIYERKELTIPWIYTDFRKGSPFTQLQLELPFVGIVDLAPEDFFDTGIIDIRTCVNLLNGHVDYKITDGSDHNKTVANFSAQCGGTIPIGSMQIQNASQVVSGAVNLATQVGGFGVASNLEQANINTRGNYTNPFELSDLDNYNYATKIGSSMMDFIQAANTKSANVIGSYSGGFGETLNTEYNVIVKCRTSSEEPMNLNALYGNPCGKVLSLQNMSGFVQTNGFSISIASTKEVKNLINTLMDSGVYIE
jgi:hypothetical protein